MKFLFNKKFTRRHAKLNHKIREKFEERLRLFQDNPTDQVLNIHKLSGKYDGMWSMNVTGDYRAIFNKQRNDFIVFLNIGTHPELFG